MQWNQGTIRRLEQALVEGGGGVDLASTAETITGSSVTKAVTPAGLKGAAPQFDIRSYGATGDGITDDTIAIQAAINAANTIGSGTVIVPSTSATYRFTALDIKANVTLTSTGGWLKLMDGVCVDTGTAYYPIRNVSAGANARIIGLLVDGNSANNLDFLVADLITMAGAGCEVRNCHLLNPPDSGVMFSQVVNGCCRDNLIESTTTDNCDAGIYVNDGDGDHAHENVISGNRIIGFNAGGIALKRISRRCVVTDNVIYNCGNGITLEHGSTTTDFSTNITIANNRMRYIGYIDTSQAGCGMILRGSDWVTCVGNRIDDARAMGIYCEAPRWSTIANNVITLESGALSTCDGIRVSDRAVLTRGTQYCTFTGNIINTPNRHGFYLTTLSTYASSYNTYTGNVVTGAAAGSAFRIESYHDNSIVTGNVFDGLIDLELYAGATSIYAANNQLVNGANSGCSQFTWLAETGRLNVGNVDTYITRAAADIVDGPVYRSRGSVVAFQGGSYPVTIGNVGSVAGVGFAPAASAPDSTISRTGVNSLKTAGTWTIDGALDHNGTTFGVYGVTPATRPTAYTQTYATATRTHSNPTATALTDNTTGTANTTLEALTSGTVYATDVAAIRNNFADLAAAVNVLIVDVANAKQVLNSVIDDDQTVGLKQ